MSTKVFVIILVVIVGVFITTIITKDPVENTEEISLGGGSCLSSGQVATSGAMVINGEDTTILGSSTRSCYRSFQNDSAAIIYLSFDDDAPVTLEDYAVRLNASGGFYEMLRGDNYYNGSVHATSTIEGGRILIQEIRHQ